MTAKELQANLQSLEKQFHDIYKHYYYDSPDEVVLHKMVAIEVRIDNILDYLENSGVI